MSTRFHYAVKDGLFSELKIATKADANSRDEEGMTPLLWTAHQGNLDALKLLIGKGGNPSARNNSGDTALHLTAKQGHIDCVNFLVTLGENIYSLNMENHTAKDLAALANQDKVLAFLDNQMNGFETFNRKKAEALQSEAKKDLQAFIAHSNRRKSRSNLLDHLKIGRKSKLDPTTSPTISADSLSSNSEVFFGGSFK
ncbi:USH1G family protein [Megaselia abdita]